MRFYATHPAECLIHSRHLLNVGRTEPWIQAQDTDRASGPRVSAGIQNSSSIETQRVTMDTVTSPSPFTTQKIDICKVFHPVTNTTRSSSEEFQSQARDERDFMEGNHRGLMTSSTNNRKTGFPQSKRTIFNTFHTHFPPSSRRAWLFINFL